MLSGGCGSCEHLIATELGGNYALKLLFFLLLCVESFLFVLKSKLIVFLLEACLPSCERPPRQTKIVHSLISFTVWTLACALGLDALDEALNLFLRSGAGFLLAIFIIRVDCCDLGLRCSSRIIKFLQLLVPKRDSIFRDRFTLYGLFVLNELWH